MYQCPMMAKHTPFETYKPTYDNIDLANDTKLHHVEKEFSISVPQSIGFGYIDGFEGTSTSQTGFSISGKD